MLRCHPLRLHAVILLAVVQLPLHIQLVVTLVEQATEWIVVVGLDDGTHPTGRGSGHMADIAQMVFIHDVLSRQHSATSVGSCSRPAPTPASAGWQFC